MVLGKYQDTCKELIFGQLGFSLSACEIIEEAGYKYMKFKFGAVTEKAIRFSIKLLNMTCSNENLKAIVAKILRGENDPEEIVTVFLPLYP
jgi:hypothetical protein